MASLAPIYPSIDNVSKQLEELEVAIAKFQQRQQRKPKIGHHQHLKKKEFPTTPHPVLSNAPFRRNGSIAIEMDDFDTEAKIEQDQQDQQDQLDQLDQQDQQDQQDQKDQKDQQDQQDQQVQQDQQDQQQQEDQVLDLSDESSSEEESEPNSGTVKLKILESRTKIPKILL